MAKQRRTRKQKMGAKRATISYSLPELGREVRTQSNKADAGLMGYDFKLIKADLTKTMILSILAVATIVAIYYFKLI